MLSKLEKLTGWHPERLVSAHTNSGPLASLYDATALPPAQPVELVKAACLWLFLRCRPHRHIEADPTLHYLSNPQQKCAELRSCRFVVVQAYFIMPFQSTQYSAHTG